MKGLGVAIFGPIKCVFGFLQASEHYFTVLLRAAKAVTLFFSLET